MWRIRYFLKSVKNLIQWFTIIWNDRDWDYNYLYELLYFKLKRMEKFYRKEGHFIGCEKQADKIKKCVLVLERMIKDNYEENVFKNHDIKWGKIEMTSEESSGGLSRLILKRKNALTEEEKAKETKEWKRLHKHLDYLIKQDLDYLFNMMKKHIRSWWD